MPDVLQRSDDAASLPIRNISPSTAEKRRAGQEGVDKLPGRDLPTEHHSGETAEDEDYSALEVSLELPPPPLPPRPAKVQQLADPSLSPSGSLTVPSARPKLQSKATTALSLADVHTPLPTDVGHRTQHRAASSVRSFSNLGRHASRGGSDTEDNASIRSVRSYIPGYGGDVVSLLGDFSGVDGDVSTKDAGLQFQDDHLFESSRQEDDQFEAYLRHEFDDLEALAPDGSNEEALMIRWKLKLKHFLILSSAGKPIYSRHGDDQLISTFIGIIQTIISIFVGADDTLKGFTAGDARFVILSKGHLHLVAISRMGETDAQLRAQLEALYMQILSTLTLPTMQRMFLNRPSTDLRRPLEGTDRLLSALADGFTRGSPSTLLSALESLRVRKTQRDEINRTMAKCKSPNLLYGLIVAGGRLVSVVRPRKHSLHPGDLQLIFNMLFEAEGVRAGGGENWIPICLPGFNNTGYLYMYVSFLRASRRSEEITERSSTTEGRQDEIAIILISAKKEGFFELRTMRDDLVNQLEANGGMSAIRGAVKRGRLLCTDIVPGTVVRHFLYKSRANVQFTMPSPEPHFSNRLAWRRLISLYDSMHGSVHGKNAHLKIQTTANRNYVSLAWVTPLFEMYCVASANANRDALALGANRIVKWAQAEEQRLFVIGGAVF